MKNIQRLICVCLLFFSNHIVMSTEQEAKNKSIKNKALTFIDTLLGYYFQPNLKEQIANEYLNQSPLNVAVMFGTIIEFEHALHSLTPASSQELLGMIRRDPMLFNRVPTLQKELLAIARNYPAIQKKMVENFQKEWTVDLDYLHELWDRVDAVIKNKPRAEYRRIGTLSELDYQTQFILDRILRQIEVVEKRQAQIAFLNWFMQEDMYKILSSYYPSLKKIKDLNSYSIHAWPAFLGAMIEARDVLSTKIAASHSIQPAGEKADVEKEKEFEIEEEDIEPEIKIEEYAPLQERYAAELKAIANPQKGSGYSTNSARRSEIIHLSEKLKNEKNKQEFFDWFQKQRWPAKDSLQGKKSIERAINYDQLITNIKNADH